MARSLEQWLSHQARAHPHSIDLGLDRLKLVLQRLKWHQPVVPVITVAGTNGKGSVAAYCAAVLTAAGFRVGVFTSPHLRDYRERIRIHDHLVTTGALLSAFERIEAASADCGASLTFFEYNAVAAFLCFEAAGLDAWVLEVGMGGRLDAVNVVDATVAVVVSIGLDHQEFLGDTVDAIAQEKAGVSRSGRATVIGSRTANAALLEGVLARGATPKRLGIDFDYERIGPGWSYRGTRWSLTQLPSPALLGEVQYGNAATALAALEELSSKLPVPPAAVAHGLRSVRLIGRFQVIAPAADQPSWILDVAHNPDAARVLGDNLRARPIGGRTLAICGMLADKDALAVAAEMAGCIDEWWLATTEGERGISAAVLAARIAGTIGVSLSNADSVADACAAAAAAAGASDRIVVFGSFHTVGPALDWLEARGLLTAAELPEYTRAPPTL